MTGPTVDVPGIGTVKREYVIVAAVGLAVVGGYTYYKRKQASTAGTATVSAIDPATGQPYGSAADAAQLNAQSGYLQPTGSGLGGSSPTPQPTQSGFTSNDQWSQAVVQYMTSSTGADPAVVGAALGRYLAGEPVSGNDKALVLQAVAFEGHPPVPGANGFPPSIRDAPAVPTPAPPPAKKLWYQYYVTIHGDTLRNISARTFGANAGANWYLIRQVNSNLSHYEVDSALPAGLHIRIPHTS